MAAPRFASVIQIEARLISVTGKPVEHLSEMVRPGRATHLIGNPRARRLDLTWRRNPKGFVAFQIGDVEPDTGVHAPNGCAAKAGI